MPMPVPDEAEEQQPDESKREPEQYDVEPQEGDDAKK